MKDMACGRIRAMTGIVKTGHFVLDSGEHTTTYPDVDTVFTYPGITDTVCQGLFNECRDLKFEVVVGVGTGGAILAHGVSSLFERRLCIDVRSDYAELVPGTKVTFKVTDHLVQGKNVVIAYDSVLSRKTPVEWVMRAVKNAGGTTIAVATVFSRKELTATELGFPRLIQIEEIEMERWRHRRHCPQCIAGIDVNTELGCGKRFANERTARALITAQRPGQADEHPDLA